jgi:hypothetical protein
MRHFDAIIIRAGQACSALAARLPGYALFIDPPLARVGMTDAEAAASGRRLLHSKRPMTGVGRAVEAEDLGVLIQLGIRPDAVQYGLHNLPCRLPSLKGGRY